MTPPTPAAVRAALKDGRAEPLTSDERDACLDDGRMDVALLRDHIRAVCAEMRGEAERLFSSYEKSRDAHALEQCESLYVWANKLEGREP